jgi:hypothetical protein
MINIFNVGAFGILVLALSVCNADDLSLNIPHLARLHGPQSMAHDNNHREGIGIGFVDRLLASVRTTLRTADSQNVKKKFLYCKDTGAVIAVDWKKMSFWFLAIPKTTNRLLLLPATDQEIKEKGLDVDRLLKIHQLRAGLSDLYGSYNVAVIADLENQQSPSESRGEDGP